ncbi:hypothetical protein [Streptomyces sp. NPDC013187]|uniref:hypothetical protein n=1 Tax=Streptomyces sp. NPDC013187 TaxID=3364865 RepID=UPI0036B8CD63
MPALPVPHRAPRTRLTVRLSGDFVPNEFDGPDVGLLRLGIGALGAQSPQFQNDYWHHTLEATRPDLIVPVHWTAPDDH